MASVNRVMLIGRLGHDPELKYTPQGMAVCKFALATSESWVGKDGQKQENTEWHKVVVWNKAAENVAKYLAKGRSCYVEGKIQTQSWEDKNGQKCYATEIVASSVQFLESGSQPQRAQGQQAQAEGRPDLEQIPF